MELLDLGKAPISEAEPAGTDVRYDPDFDLLQKEIDKMSSATAGGEINWNRIIELGSSILARKSKDIQVAAYLSAGLIEVRRLEGLAIGLTILNDLVNNFWDKMFPPLKRIRGRLNAIGWWMDRTTAFLQAVETAPLPEETVERLKDQIKALDQFLAEKSDDAPGAIVLD